MLLSEGPSKKGLRVAPKTSGVKVAIQIKVTSGVAVQLHRWNAVVFVREYGGVMISSK